MKTKQELFVCRLVMLSYFMNLYKIIQYRLILFTMKNRINNPSYGQGKIITKYQTTARNDREYRIHDVDKTFDVFS